jgi:hypothetical protein
VVGPLLLSLAAFGVTRANAGYPERFAAGAASLGSAGATEAKGECSYNRDLTLTPQCVIGASGAQARGLLVGDSYAGMYTDFLEVLAKDARLAFNHRWYRLSPPMPGTSASDQFGMVQSEYSQRRHELLARYDVALLASSWGGYRYAPKDKTRLWNAARQDVSARADELQLAAIDDLVRRGVRVVLLDRPRAPPGRPLMREMRDAIARRRSLASFSAPIPARPGDYVLDLVRKKHPGVLIIRPDEPICDDKSCRVALGDQPLYRPDGSHLSHEGSKLLGEAYLQKLPNPLKRLR